MKNRSVACWTRTACAALFLTAAAQAHAGQLEQIREKKEFVIAHRDASIPFSYLDADKKPVGYAMELCHKIAEAVQKELKLPQMAIRYLQVTSASRLSTIAEGKASLECGSTTNTVERRKTVDFTIPHFISSSRLLVRADSKIERLADLAGKTAVSTKGTTNVKTLERLNSEQLLKIKIGEAQDHAEAFSLVASGKVDAFAMDDVLLYGLRANSGTPDKFAVVGKPMTIEPYAIIIPKGDEGFKKVVDNEMRRIILSGEINAIYRKWFQQPIPPKGITMDLPMPYLLKDSFKYPSDKVADI
ncbi:MAG: amino acid ABC transporter substrate-binding protein [Burkholderiaceae bacterium]